MVIDKNYLFSKKIGVGQYYGHEEDDVQIELREVGGVAAAKFRACVDNTEATVVYFLSILPGCIVEHSLWKDEANKYTATEVTEMIGGRAEMCLDLMGRYMKEVLFTQGKKIEKK